MKQTLVVIGGAIAGGTLGYFAFFWILSQGFYAMMLPGGLLGFGASMARNRNRLLAVLCGIAALALGIFAEWRAYTFVEDDSLKYLIFHIHEKTPITLLMIAIGGFLGFWLPFPRNTKPEKHDLQN